MIEIVHQTQNCLCDQCRSKRSRQYHRHGRRLNKKNPYCKNLPLGYAQGASTAYDGKCSTRQREDGLTTIAALGTPAGVSLNMYPEELSHEMHNTMQFFLEVFQESIHPHVDIPEGWNPRGYWAEKMSYALADPMWFAGTIAFASAMKQKALTGQSKKSSEVMRYSGKAIAGLRNRIAADKSRVDDLALLTIISLMSADIVNREVKQWKAHIDGIDRILAARGGLESLNGDQYVKHKLIGFQLFWLYKQMSMGTAPEHATYPDHPFPPDVCVAISKMPEPLSDLALGGCLCIDLINSMAPILSLASKFVKHGLKEREDLRRIKCLAYDIEELFTITDLTQLELLIILALIEFAITLDMERKQHWLIVGSCQINCARILVTDINYDPTRHDVLLWIGAMLVAAGEPSLQSAKVGQKILTRCRKEVPFDRNTVLAHCQQYAWDNVLTEKLDIRFDYDGTLSPSSESPATLSDTDSRSRTLSPESFPVVLSKTMVV